MSYSLNEVAATAMKATRAVGYPWGLAEEAASSVRWLCHQDIDGCAVLARYLEKVDGQIISSRSPIIDGRQWSGAIGSLCPLLTGTALSDRASSAADQRITLQRVTEPLLLLYFAALVPRQRAALDHSSYVISVSWSDCRFTTDGVRMSISGPADQQIDVCADELIVEMTSAAESLPEPVLESPQELRYRATPSESTWQILNQFALRTYCPATEESRIKGAGAGLSDND